MTWFGILTIVLVLAVLMAVTGLKPRGTRPVARTQLMTVARVVLGGVLLLILYLVFRGNG